MRELYKAIIDGRIRTLYEVTNVFPYITSAILWDCYNKEELTFLPDHRIDVTKKGRETL